MIDATTGRISQQVSLFAEPPDAPRIHRKNTHASPTPVIDGKHIYVHFGQIVKGKIVSVCFGDCRDNAFHVRRVVHYDRFRTLVISTKLPSFQGVFCRDHKCFFCGTVFAAQPLGWPAPQKEREFYRFRCPRSTSCCREIIPDFKGLRRTSGRLKICRNLAKGSAFRHYLRIYASRRKNSGFRALR